MRTIDSLARLAGLCLLTLAGTLQAATTNTITVTADPKTGGDVSGGGKYAEGSTASVAATNNDCYEFIDWTVGGKKITNNPYSFTVKGNESLTANFEQIKYAITTSSSPTNGGATSGGGKIGCGETAKLTAKANAGFAFTEWTSTGLEAPNTNKEISFSVSGSESWVAHFKDIQPPKIAITAPVKNESIPTSAFVVQGTAIDKVGVLAVYYNLNGGGWQAASTTNGFTNWHAYVTLPPNSANTVSAYAQDTIGNMGTNSPVSFKCTAAGFAPLSIAEQLATVTSGTGENNSFLVSFDTAVYVRISDTTSDGGEVGTYTYTPTGPDTAELVPQRALPQQSGSSNDVLELTFTDAYDATYTEGSNSSGTIAFSATEESVPASLDGAVIIETSFENTSLMTTNTFDSGTFTQNNNQGGSSSGAYTFTPFTPTAALVVETSANPASNDPITNYLVLSFNVAATPPSYLYFSAAYGASGLTNEDVGSFAVSTSIVSAKFLGPITEAGLQAEVKPTGEPSTDDFTRTFGKGTFASMYIPPGTNFLLFTNGPNDVGIHLSNTRVSADTGVATFMALAPPYAVGLDDYMVDVLWNSPTSATSSNLVSGETATLVFSPLKNNAPAALTGQEITAKDTGASKAGTIKFNYNNFVGGGDLAGLSGTYTYAPYTPTMALVQLNATDFANAGEVQYVLLNFKSTDSGTYVNSRTVAVGLWRLRPGTFSMKPAE